MDSATRKRLFRRILLYWLALHTGFALLFAVGGLLIFGPSILSVPFVLLGPFGVELPLLGGIIERLVASNHINGDEHGQHLQEREEPR